MPKRKPSAVTIRGVAERAGVSAMTVSNVVNGTGRVSPATAEVVRAAIRELGYSPNLSARRLANARATTVGLMYNDQRTPFLEAILVGALRALNARGMQLLLHEGDAVSSEQALEAAGSLVRSGADALLLVPPYPELLSGRLAAIDVPAAAIASGTGLPDIATVRIDNRAAMHDLTRLVLSRGHTRIGFVAGPDSHGDSAERRLGFRDALAEAGIAADPELDVRGWFDYASGIEAARRLLGLDWPPTAIVSSNDDMAAGVIAEALRRGLSLPGDLAVTGFDDTLIAARLWPPLTVIRQPVELMAFTAVEQLVGAMAAGAVGGVFDHLLDHELIDRLSVPSRSPRV